MAILSFKRWERVGFETEPGTFLYMKMKRLRRSEARPLARLIVAVFEQVQKSKGEELTLAQKKEVLDQAFEQMPEDELRAWFGTCVRDVEDFEMDGVPVTTGEQLLDEVDDDLLFSMLLKLSALSKLTQAEGNASASRSTSRLVVEGDGASPARPIEREAGAELSTATAIQTEPSSYIAQG